VVKKQALPVIEEVAIEEKVVSTATEEKVAVSSTVVVAEEVKENNVLISQ
jgi:hypothetical protein